MAASMAYFSLFLAFSLFVSGVLGAITCEELDRDTCAFAVSTDGYRCMLEKHAQGEDYSCITSCVEVSIGLAGWVESDQCVAACGLDRHTLGISSDSMRNVSFLRRLCSSQCSKKCRNIHDLYFNVAAGEVKWGRRQMVETREKSGASTNSAPSPTSTVKYGRKLIDIDSNYAPKWFIDAASAPSTASAPVGSLTTGAYIEDDGSDLLPVGSPMNSALAPVGPSTKLTDIDEDDAPSASVGSPTTLTDIEDDGSDFPPVGSPTNSALAPVGSSTKRTDIDEADAPSTPVSPTTLTDIEDDRNVLPPVGSPTNSALAPVGSSTKRADIDEDDAPSAPVGSPTTLTDIDDGGSDSPPVGSPTNSASGPVGSSFVLQ